MTIATMYESTPDLNIMKDTTTYVDSPYVYGHIPSSQETHLQDIQDITNQEYMLLSIGAVTGISLIVLGILITSNNSNNST
jgi:hypothetical protein